MGRSSDVLPGTTPYDVSTVHHTGGRSIKGCTVEATALDLGNAESAGAEYLDALARQVHCIAAHERLRRQHNGSSRVGHGDRAVHRGRLRAAHRPGRLLAMDAAP